MRPVAVTGVMFSAYFGSLGTLESLHRVILPSFGIISAIVPTPFSGVRWYQLSLNGVRDL